MEPIQHWLSTNLSCKKSYSFFPLCMGFTLIRNTRVRGTLRWRFRTFRTIHRNRFWRLKTRIFAKTERDRFGQKFKNCVWHFTNELFCTDDDNDDGVGDDDDNDDDVDDDDNDGLSEKTSVFRSLRFFFRSDTNKKVDNFSERHVSETGHLTLSANSEKSEFFSKKKYFFLIF